MLFINKLDKPLHFFLVPGGTPHDVEPFGEVEIEDCYAYVIPLYGLPLEPIAEKAKATSEEPAKQETKPEKSAKK